MVSVIGDCFSKPISIRPSTSPSPRPSPSSDPPTYLYHRLIRITNQTNRRHGHGVFRLLGFISSCSSNPLVSHCVNHISPFTAASMKKKKPKTQTPEYHFNHTLNSCSKTKDLRSAISLYDSTISQKTLRLTPHHFNTLLYLCSTSLADADSKELSVQYGFRIFDHMVSEDIKPNEASITAMTRLAAAKGDGDYAFELVKNLEVHGVSPRLRTCSPALLCLCEKLEAEKAYEVEEYMGSVGVSLEEPEITALLRVSGECGRDDRVYWYLHKLRRGVRGVRIETAKVIEDWFRGFQADGVDLDANLVREAVSKNGGGWHGMGWIGRGRWVVRTGSLDAGGKCCCCGEQLVCVDIDDEETQMFAESVAGLAFEREAMTNFCEFQCWLDKHGEYEAIVDGANIGLYQQNFAEGGFSISQLDAVVKELYSRHGNKWPLIILHNKRLRALLENPAHRELVHEWTEKDALYTTPHGSNDDWYWLYAAVKLRCLLVTNDEMRDHIFELLGSNFFLTWKERHQVRYTFEKGNLKLQMPPSFSVVIQESEKGSWHVPLAGDGTKSAQTWLCITRPDACDATSNVEAASLETYASNHGVCCNAKMPCKPGSIQLCNGKVDSQNHPHSCEPDDKAAGRTGKRKIRSPSPPAEYLS